MFEKSTASVESNFDRMDRAYGNDNDNDKTFISALTKQQM